MISISAVFELNKAEKMIAAGNVSKKGIDKLKVAKSIRSGKKYMKGIDKGTAYKLRETGNKIKKSKISDIAGPFAMPVDSPLGKGVNMPKGNSVPFRTIVGLKTGVHLKKSDLKKEGPLLRRHEADELSSAVKKGRAQLPVGAPGAMTFVNKKNKVIGKHMSPEVLRREKKLTDFTTKAYGVGKKLKAMRKATGEDSYIKDKSRRDIRKEEKKSDKGIRRGSEKLETAKDDFEKTGETGSAIDKLKGVASLIKRSREAAKDASHKIKV